MIRRVVPALVLVLALGGTAIPSQASEGNYKCIDSAPVALATGAGLSGPSCGFVVTCPTTTVKCALFADATVAGIGYVAVYAEIGDISPGQCEGPLTCSAFPEPIFLGPGDQASVHAYFVNVFSPQLAVAALATVQVRARRIDS